MNVKKINSFIPILFLIVFILPLVGSLAFQQNSNSDIKHAIRVDGGIPNSATLCNISIYYPNNTFLINFQEMTNQNDYFNFTLDVNQTRVIGQYDYDVTCFSGNLNKTDSFEFYINPGGIEPSTTKTDAITRSIYFIFGIGILLFIGFLKSQDNFTFKYSFFLLSLLFFLISINLIFISLQDEVVNPTFQNFFSSFVAISFYLYFFFGFLLFSLWTIAIINTVLYQNNIKEVQRLEGI